MTHVLMSALLAAMVLSGCGGSDSKGLYESTPSAEGGTSGSDASGSVADASTSATDASSPGQESESESGPQPDDPPFECKNDDGCLPLVCNTELGHCEAPGPAGAPCGRPVECQSGRCKKHECQ